MSLKLTSVSFTVCRPSTSFLRAPYVLPSTGPDPPVHALTLSRRFLASQHPSPLSASRGFIGNNHFKQCNEWLERKYGRKSADPVWRLVRLAAAAAD